MLNAGPAAPWTTRVSTDNLRLLEVQNPKLAAEGIWAHATPAPEKGGLLLATPEVTALTQNDKLWQVLRSPED